MTDPRPTQLDVEAEAVRMFGADWKQPWLEQRRGADQVIAQLLDQARLNVMAGRS